MKKWTLIIIVILLIVGAIGLYDYMREVKIVENMENLESQAKEVIEVYEAEILKSSESYEFLGDFMIGETGYVFLLDENYLIKFHVNDSMINQNINDIVDVFNQPLSRLETEKELLFRYEYENVERAVYFYQASDGNILCIIDILE